MRVKRSRSKQANITDDMKFAIKVVGEFSKEQPKNIRKNIYTATNRLNRMEPLSEIDQETLREFGEFLSEYNFARGGGA